MKKLKINFKKNKYLYLGIYFLIIQLLIIYRNYSFKEPLLYFYFCNTIALILGIGFLTKNMNLIKGTINIGLIPQTVYMIDVIAKVTTGSTLIAGLGNLFTYSTIPFIITIILHSLTSSVAIFITYKEKTQKRSLIYSISILLFLYVSTLLFTDNYYDFNCVYNACGIDVLQFKHFTKLWLPLTLIVVVFPTYYIQKYLNKKNN